MNALCYLFAILTLLKIFGENGLCLENNVLVVNISFKEMKTDIYPFHGYHSNTFLLRLCLLFQKTLLFNNVCLSWLSR